MDNNIKKTIIFISHDAKFSGATYVLKEYFDEWSKKKAFDIVCIFPEDGEFKSYCDELGIKTIVYRYWFWTLEKDHCSFIDYCKLLVKLLISYVGTCCIYYRIASFCKPSLVYTNSSVIPEGAWLSKMFKIKHVWHVHEYCVDVHDARPLLGRKHLHKYMYNNANVLILVSKSLLEYFAEDVPRDRLKLVYNTVQPVTINNFKNWGSIRNNSLVVGNFTLGKHQDIAVKAVKEILNLGYDFNLLMIGGHNTNNSKFYNLIKKQICDPPFKNRIQLLDLQKDLSTYRSNCGIAIVASEYESFGRVTVESMLFGMIVIANDSGASPELIVDGYNGFLFAYNDEKSLSNKILEVFQMSEADINRIRKNAMDTAAKYLNNNFLLEISSIIDKMS